MTSAASPAARTTLELDVLTAGDLMTPNPVSIAEDATLENLLTLFADRGISAAPVIDEAGRPHGVVSRSDVLIHLREKARNPTQAGELLVRDIMTPAVFSVTPDTPVHSVVEQLVALNIHRLFVVNEDGAPIGVISAVDILKHLH